MTRTREQIENIPTAEEIKKMSRAEARLWIDKFNTDCDQAYLKENPFGQLSAALKDLGEAIKRRFNLLK